MDSFSLKKWIQEMDGLLFVGTQAQLGQGLHYRLYNQFETPALDELEAELVDVIEGLE